MSAVVTAAPAEAERTHTARSPTDVPPERAPVLESVPRPSGDQTLVALPGITAGGLDAVQAEWGLEGGEVLLTGRRPFLDVTGRASFRPDGTLNGDVRMRANVQILGLPLGAAEWSVSGWTPQSELATPLATLQGTQLRLDLAGLPEGTTLAPAPSLATAVDGTSATIALPGDAVPSGEPLSPRMAELFRGLLGVDVSGLQVHADAPVAEAPAFVTNADLFFAPGIYGVDSPETLRILDAAVRAAIAGIVGPIGATAAPPPNPPPPAGAAAPAADTSLVPATVPDAGAEAAAPSPLVGETAGEAPPASAGEGAVGEAAAEAGPADAAAEGGAPAVPVVEVLMPEAPAEPTPATAARGGAVAGGAGGAARSATTLPDAAETTDAAHGAVTEPASETAARAQEGLAAELGAAPAPSPEIVELCERIRTAIRENRPEDEDDLLESDPTQAAQSAGSTITSSVDGQVTEVSGSYDAMATPPAGSPATTPVGVVPPDPSSAGMGVNAGTAAPDAIPPENTNLDADVAATDQRVADSGMETRVTAEIPDGPFQAQRDARGELGELAQRTPEEIHAEEQASIDTAQADMANLQLQAVAAMRAARGRTVGEVGGAQAGATSGEELTRDNVSQRAQAVYDQAEHDVGELLTPLSRTAMAQWDAGLTRLSREFHDSLDRVQRWIDDRHSGALGTLVAIGDYIGGLPDWVTDEYNRAEREFGDGVCDLLLQISSDVNGVIASARALIQGARDEINGMFDQMAAEYPDFAATERARFGGMLDGLSTRVTEAQTSFVRDVSARAITAVNEAHATVQAKREEAGGLIGRVVAAIAEFIDDPVRAIINGLLRLVGIPPAAFWSLLSQIEQVIGDIADDPENFINNLTAGVKLGFSQFFDNFGTHLLGAFWNWLFSGLRTPIPMPSSFDPMSLVSFALQLMGITWPNIREILVRHLGPEAVELLEIAWQILSVLITQGPMGLVNMIKDMLSPENIVGMILDAAIDYIVEKLIVKAAEYIFSLLNPAGAVAQAIMLIYRVCSWIFRNAARIFAFVQAVVGGMANVIAGNISGLAGVVERALASMLVVVIDLFMGLLGLGDLPDEVADVIERMQAYILGIIDQVVGFIVTQARALLRRLGIGGEEDDEADNENDDEELGKTVRFTGGHESHRLWIDRSGDTATVMVASTAGPVEAKLAEWRGILGNETGERKALLDEIDAKVAELDGDADALAAQFEAALQDPNDSNPVPTDAPVEAKQDSLAGLLRRAFEAFGQADEPTILRWIMASLPAAVAPFVNGADTTLSGYLTEAKYVALRQEVAAPIWATGAGVTEAQAAAEAAGSNRTNHLQLVPWFRDGNKTEADASTPAFFSHATAATGARGFGEAVRRAYGQGYLDALKAAPIANLDPIDTATPQAVAGMHWRVSGTNPGIVVSPPKEPTEADPPLRTVVGGDLLVFLRGMATGGPVQGYGLPRLRWAFDSHSPSRHYLKDSFRGLRPGSHEWIPTDQLINVVDRAVSAAMVPGSFQQGVQWINLYHHLRTDTTRVYYKIVSTPTRPTVSDPLYEAGAGLHSGVAYRGRSGRAARRGVGLMDQGTFHEELRTVFANYPLTDPWGYIDTLRRALGTLLWDGNLASTGVDPTLWDEPLSYWFRVEGGGPRFRGATLSDLALAQQANRAAINADLDRAYAHLNDQ